MNREKFLIFNFQFSKRRSNGVTSLATVIVMGAIVLEFAITGALLVYFLNTSNLGFKLAGEALSAAQSGVQDALLRITRDRTITIAKLTYVNLSKETPPALPQTFPSAVSVTITASLNGGVYTITSVGQSLTKFRKLQAVAAVDAFGKLTVMSIKELTN